MSIPTPGDLAKKAKVKEEERKREQELLSIQIASLEAKLNAPTKVSKTSVKRSRVQKSAPSSSTKTVSDISSKPKKKFVLRPHMTDRPFKDHPVLKMMLDTDPKNK